VPEGEEEAGRIRASARAAAPAWVGSTVHWPSPLPSSACVSGHMSWSLPWPSPYKCSARRPNGLPFGAIRWPPFARSGKFLVRLRAKGPSSSCLTHCRCASSPIGVWRTAGSTSLISFAQASVPTSRSRGTVRLFAALGLYHARLRSRPTTCPSPSVCRPSPKGWANGRLPHGDVCWRRDVDPCRR